MKRRVCCGTVPPLAEGFHPRPETAARVGQALQPGAVIVLAAPDDGDREPGSPTGKTQLAVSAADSLWRSSGADLIAWVDASSQASMLSGYAEAAAAIGAGPAGDAEAAAAVFVAALARTSLSWLVVLDGVTGAADLTGLWPEGPGGSVMLTVAEDVAVPGGNRVVWIPVGGFSEREALSYLTGRLIDDPDRRHGAVDLATDLCGEPLALGQAGAVIASTGLSCQGYRDQFIRMREQLASAAGQSPSPAAVTWALSYNEAERLSAGLSVPAVLVFAALLDGRAIPAPVFTTQAACTWFGMPGTADPRRVRDVLARLERAGLLTVSWGGSPPSVWISPAVQASIRAVSSAEMTARAARAAADALAEVWPQEEQYPWLTERLRSCAVSVQNLAPDALWQGRWHPLVPRAGQSFESTGLAGPAVTYWRQAAAASGQMLPPGHPDALAAGSRMAAACLAAGQPAEAVTWYQRVLSAQVRVAGPGHPAAIATRIGLGRALLAAGEPGTGIKVLGAVVEDCEQLLGAGHARTLDAREELAAAYRSAGRLADAARLYRRSLADRERIQGRRHPRALAARALLAAVCLDDGDIKQATGLYKKVLADREDVLGADHPDTIAVRASLAAACQSAGRMAAALQLGEQAHADSGRVFGADDPRTLACGADLARAYQAAGRVGDAVRVLRDAAARCDRVLAPDDPLAATVRKALAGIGGP